MIKVKNPEALSHKFPNVGGISTRDGEVTNWPESLPKLTQDAVDLWEAEFKAVKKSKPDLQGAIQALIDGDTAKAQTMLDK